MDPYKRVNRNSTLSATQSDPRFSSFAIDPRYRLPRKKDTHIKLDKRFSRLLNDEDFSRRAKIDRYGRKIQKSEGNKKKRELERLYDFVDQGEGDVEEDDEADDDEEVLKELERVERDDELSAGNFGAKKPDAKYVGYSESSSSEEESEESSSEEEESEEEDAAVEAGLEGFSGNPQDTVPTGDVSTRLAVVNLDWDHIRAVDLMAVAQSFCPKGGAIESVVVYPSEFGRERMEKEDMEGPDREIFAKSASRAAQKEADRAQSHQGPMSKAQQKQRSMSVESSASEISGSNEDQSQSEDDEDRIAPPSSLEEPSDEAISDQDSDIEDDEAIQKRILSHAAESKPSIDTRALRAYQLSRLRYYYAVIQCSSLAAARALYDNMDGREYLSTANFFDLRFVPEETTFPAHDSSGPDAPRDVCLKIPSGYQPAEFVTEALTHSKVRLTWEEEDRGRKEVQKRAFAAASLPNGKAGKAGRKIEMREDDLAAYIGSASSDDEEEDAENGGVSLLPNFISQASSKPTTDQRSTKKPTKKSKAAEARRTMRLALGLSVDTSDSDSASTSDSDNDSKRQTSTPKSRSKPKFKSKKIPTEEIEQGGMQITFSSALSTSHADTTSQPPDPNGSSSTSNPTTSKAKAKANKKSIFENTPEEAQETSKDRYIRKERERKARRKESRRLGSSTQQTDGPLASTTNGSGARNGIETEKETEEQDKGFADPFFTAPASTNAKLKSQASKVKKSRKEADTARDAASDAKQKEELELLMLPEPHVQPPSIARIGEAGTQPREQEQTADFNMQQILKSEKEARRAQSKFSKSKSKSSKSQSKSVLDPHAENKGERDEEGAQATFQINAADPRFSKIYDEADFNIDPSHPRYSGTEAMQALLEEGRRRRDRKRDRANGDSKGGDGEMEGVEVGDLRRDKKARRAEGEVGVGNGGGDVDVAKLIERVKRRKVG